MSGKLFIERREGEGDYAIRRPGASRINGHEPTQADAIEREGLIRTQRSK